MRKLEIKILSFLLLGFLFLGCSKDNEADKNLENQNENSNQELSNRVRLTQRQQDEKAIIDLIKEDQGLESDRISLIIEYYSSDHLRGSLFVGEEEQTTDEEIKNSQDKLQTGKIILAYRENDKWKIAYLGNGQIKCDQAKRLNFPEEMVHDCRVK
jgi:vacuolar-type H+-ATPase subunit I/STV1